MILWVLQCAVAFVATVAFAVLFHVPRTQYLYSGVTGAAGWAVYLTAVQLGLSAMIASLLSVLVLTFLSRVFSVARRCPCTVFLICGIFPLVPGAGIYYTAYYFILGQNARAVEEGGETLKMACAIALGIVLVMALPGGFFEAVGTWPRKKNKR